MLPYQVRPTTHRYQLLGDIDTPFEPGGEVVAVPAGSALNIGDAAYLNVSGNATKSATASDYAARCGIVVGGSLTDMQIRGASTDVGTAAASGAGQYVLVLIRGIAYAVAGETLSTGMAKVTGGVGASGRVGSTGAASGNYVGQVLTGGVAGTTSKLLVGYAI